MSRQNMYRNVHILSIRVTSLVHNGDEMMMISAYPSKDDPIGEFIYDGHIYRSHSRGKFEIALDKCIMRFDLPSRAITVLKSIASELLEIRGCKK